MSTCDGIPASVAAFFTSTMDTMLPATQSPYTACPHKILVHGRAVGSRPVPYFAADNATTQVPHSSSSSALFDLSPTPLALNSHGDLHRSKRPG